MRYSAGKTVIKPLIAKKTLSSREWLAPGLRLRFSQFSDGIAAVL
jgi:hypothetical protein